MKVSLTSARFFERVSDVKKGSDSVALKFLLLFSRLGAATQAVSLTERLKAAL